MCKSLEHAENLFSLIENIRKDWTNLHNRLSITDQKRSDVEHYMELSNNLNAAQGYEAYRLLKKF